jgi:hypothetical protein
MPIKQVVCSICKQMVNKAQTYHVGGDDRACKSHQGVAEKKDALEAAKKEKAVREERRDVRRAELRENGGWSQDPGLKCWVCMNPGIRHDEFFLKVLVEMEKQKKVHGLVKSFDPKYAIRLAERCIFVMSEAKAASAMNYIREDFKMMMQMAGFVAICGPCCGVCKIDPLPPVGLKEITAGVVLYTGFLEPVVSAIAGRELTRDN